MKRRQWTLFFLLGLAGCAVGPKYCPPENTVVDTWQTESLEIDTNTAPIAWWKIFQDDLLSKYIELAAINNKELLQAEAAILQARAHRNIAASKWYPQISADISAMKTYFSKNGPVFAITPGGGAGGGISSQTTGLPFSVQVPQVQTLYNALFDASWEFDLFGKTRHEVDSAQARYESQIAERNDRLISILGEVARNYMELRGYQEERILLEENVRFLSEEEDIIKQQFEKGLCDQIRVLQIISNIATAQSQLIDVHASIYRSIYALSLLTGNPPETLVDELLEPSFLPPLPDCVSVGLRSDLLRRRPDIRKAERELAAATADVGFAVASFYPSFSLIADTGFQSLSIQKLFESKSKTWALGGDVNGPIFQGGRLIAGLDSAKAGETIAFNQYQESVLAALADTEGALVTFADNKEALKEAEKNVDANDKISSRMHFQFEKGLIGKFDDLESQRQLIFARSELLQRQTASLISLITLYKSLGGGWEEEISETSDNSNS